MSTPTFDIDAEYVASQCRMLRQHFKMTQESLAIESGLTTRTIEKIESGKHAPQMQSLEMIANAMKTEVSFFRKPTPEEVEATAAAIRKGLHTTVGAMTYPIRTAAQFMGVYGGWHGRRVTYAAIEDDDVLELATTIDSYLDDLGFIWDECESSQRFEYAKELKSMFEKLEEAGYLCHMGTHKQRQRIKGRPDLIFTVGVVSFLPKADHDGERLAIIALEPGWETVPD